MMAAAERCGDKENRAERTDKSILKDTSGQRDRAAVWEAARRGLATRFKGFYLENVRPSRHEGERATNATIVADASLSSRLWSTAFHSHFLTRPPILASSAGEGRRGPGGSFHEDLLSLSASESR